MSVIVEQLSKLYGSQRAVDNISFEVKKGQVLGFLGPNGAGKSTTMKMLTCFIPPTSGKAMVGGFDTSVAPMEVSKRVGYLPESNPLYYDMYVPEYLSFVAGIHRLGKRSKARVEEMINVTGLTPERTKKIGQLSKGYKQRVGLAQAMLHDPEVLILDEPTSGLDPNQLVDVRKLIKELGREKTVILSTHIMQEVQAMCDRVVIINKGKIVADDTTERIQSRIKGSTLVRVSFKEQVEESKLKAIQGVQAVQQLVDGSWQLQAAEEVDLREQLFHFAKDNQLTLLNLSQEQSSLEDVFQKLTR